jgi:4-hydroxybenzoate polyprenyltransferase
MIEAMARSSTLPALLRAMRPKHWVKNVFVVAALVFAHQLPDAGSLAVVSAAFAIFCLLSSSVYLLNDITDREADRLHPAKKNRPVASGALSVTAAGTASVILAVAAMAAALAISMPFASIACTYLLANLAYSIALKRVVILDVMMVATGFLLRAWAGSVVIGVEMSHWLVLCTGLIALFLGFTKRRQEIATLERAAEQRPILREYSLPFLDQMIAIVTASTVLAYTLYAFSPEVAEKLGTRWMGLTIPFVLFGIFRYLYLVHQRGEGDNPTELLLSDSQLILTVLLWGGTVLLALYLL